MRRIFRHFVPIAAVAALIVAAVWQPWAISAAAEDAVVVPAPAVDLQPGPPVSEVAVLAGGCFWGVQGVFQHVEGVTRAVSGYAGGAADSAQYKLVGRGDTGHAEAVEITYDPSKISYGTLLQIYFSVAHDPTQFNYQGPDMGPQYRSAIFPANEEQARVAKAYIAQLDAAHVYGDSIVTTIESGHAFYPAEDYHQDYLTLNPTQPYIVINDLPKVENLKRLFPALYREEPVLVMAGQAGN
jgi:peptide-methionine (S)-S-oxide reductase